MCSQAIEQVGCEAITYFAKEGLQGFVITSSGGASLPGHIGFYSGPLQGAARPHQTQVGQPFLHTIFAAQWEQCVATAMWLRLRTRLV